MNSDILIRVIQAAAGLLLLAPHVKGAAPYISGLSTRIFRLLAVRS